MIIIAEKINGSIPSVARAIAQRDEGYIAGLALSQSQAGADFIDVCASVPNEIELETMSWLINTVQNAVDTPIALDSPNPHTLLSCIPLCARAGLINSVSAEKDKADIIFPAIKDTSWQVVALLSGNGKIPKSAEERLTVFDQLMKKAAEYSIDESRIHIDPLVEMLCTSDDGIAVMEQVMNKIKETHPGIHITGAVSNISFNLPARKFINQAFVVLAMKSGMDSAVLDPLKKDLIGMIYAAEACLGKDELCIDYIGAYRQGRFGEK